ncbi:hypothetical protein FB451DRAFT_1519776 [Mycena latifolia]|nr:hypothetical protein FB451DRAFT_1519776 [Mycena latifolia]
MPPPHIDPINPSFALIHDLSSKRVASGYVCIHLSPGNCMDPILTALLQSNEPLDDSQARHVRATLDATMTVLADLEGQISTTLLSLVKLKNERSRQSQYADILKGTLSPIRRIPSEILVEIFLMCRDNSLTASNYSITDPREAPMLMGHVSSRWRQVCHGAPRLWDHFHLSSMPGSMDRTASQFRPILTRSGILPLHVQFEQWYGSPTVIVDETFDAKQVWPLFHDTPQLRDLTRLELRSEMELGEAKEILVQCAMLQECALLQLFNDDGLDPPQHVHPLIHLQRLAIRSHDIFTYDPQEHVPAFALPQLTSLTITNVTYNLDGRIVADMNLAFPALATVELDLDGPIFSEDIEYRIAAASVIGPIKDRVEWY